MTHGSRRHLMKLAVVTTAAAAFALLAAPLAGAAAEGQTAADSPRKSVLFFTKSAGYQHSVITRPAEEPAKLAYAEKILTDLGAKNGFDVTCSKDGTIFSPANIEKFDVFVFFTSGDLNKESDKFATKKDADGKNVPDTSKLLHREPPMPAGAKEAFLDAIRGGKGFVGFHSASDTFHSSAYLKGKGDLLRDLDDGGKDAFDPYIQMLGGEFVIHGKQQDGTLRAINPKFSPPAAAFDGQKFTEEWYSLKNFSGDLHVILAQDPAGMTGAMYQRPPFPQTWARMHGAGRVFYTSMGHREDVWQRPDFVNLVVAALNWTSGRAEADVTPNIATATPGANASAPPATKR